MVRRETLVVAAVVMLALNGCVTAEQGPVFNPADGAYIDQYGTGKIEGWIVSRQSDGRIVTAAGNLVTLLPVTQYSQSVIASVSDESLYAGSALSNTPYEHGEQTRITYAGDRGRFAFHRLSVGDYYILGPAYTQLPRFVGLRGKGMLTRVSVFSGRTARVVMSADFPAR